MNFFCEVFSNHPGISVKQALENEGFNPDEIGMELICRTEKVFEQYHQLGISPSETREEASLLSVQEYRELQCNPYVKKASSDEIVLDSSLFRLAFCLRDAPIDTIQNTFMIPHRFYTLPEKGYQETYFTQPCRYQHRHYLWSNSLSHVCAGKENVDSEKES